jgi:hypothetical protein
MDLVSGTDPADVGGDLPLDVLSDHRCCCAGNTYFRPTTDVQRKQKRLPVELVSIVIEVASQAYTYRYIRDSWHMDAHTLFQCSSHIMLIE